MTTEEALGDYLVERRIVEAGTPPDQWYASGWIYLRVLGLKIPFFPIYGLRGPVMRHDLHHMLSGYETTWRGECELGAWELASGGCGWNVYMWFDRLFFLLVGLIFTPRATARAFARGRTHHNLYRRRTSELLATDLDEVRAWALGAGG